MCIKLHLNLELYDMLQVIYKIIIHAYNSLETHKIYKYVISVTKKCVNTDHPLRLGICFEKLSMHTTAQQYQRSFSFLQRTNPVHGNTMKDGCCFCNTSPMILC